MYFFLCKFLGIFKTVHKKISFCFNWLPGLNLSLDHRLNQIISIRVNFVNFRLQQHTPRRKTRKQTDMSNSEETSAATTHDQVKLVKVNPKDELYLQMNLVHLLFILINVILIATNAGSIACIMPLVKYFVISINLCPLFGLVYLN